MARVRESRFPGMEDVIIVGAGPAGLACAWELRRRGLPVRVLDGAPRVGEPWRGRHEALRLNTHRRFSALPGQRLPKTSGAFPSRDEYVAYLERYERHLGVVIEWGIRAERLERDPAGWRLDTSKGEIRARDVVLATGPDRVQVMPAWPGAGGFPGELIHAARFRRADDYAGRRVLVVGAGNSGIDVASCLSRAPLKELWVSSRSGAVVVPRTLWGLPVQPLAVLARPTPRGYQDRSTARLSRLAFGDLRPFGIATPAKGALTRFLEDGVAVATDDGFVAALRAGRAEVVAEIQRFEGPAVRLADGRVLHPDAVICATGYRPGLEPLVGHLGVLDARGRPRFVGGEGSPDHPGLWFSGQRPSFHGNLHARGLEARALGRSILRARQVRLGSARRRRLLVGRSRPEPAGA
jgi:cation diffusion facilitator CzcD-associated flavoprotein CzcO